jgi:hypothetical protein
VQFCLLCTTIVSQLKAGDLYDLATRDKKKGICTGATPRREYEISTYDIPCVTAPMKRQYYGILHIFHFHEKA